MSEPVYVYPTEEQLSRWENRREKVGESSKSQFICDMVEAGIKADKGFSTSVTLDKSARELRQERNALKDELEQKRERVEQLEELLHRGIRGEVVEYVEDNPGATFDEIVRHLQPKIPNQLNKHLDDLDGRELRHDAERDEYYPIEREEE